MTKTDAAVRRATANRVRDQDQLPKTATGKIQRYKLRALGS